MNLEKDLVIMISTSLKFKNQVIPAKDRANQMLIVEKRNLFRCFILN
jgi:hypothetical protein